MSCSKEASGNRSSRAFLVRLPVPLRAFTKTATMAAFANTSSVPATQLVELSKEFSNDGTALRDILEKEVETLRFESRSYSSTFESAPYEFERSSVLLAEALQSAATDGDDITGDPRLEQALQEQVDLANQQVANLSTLMDLNQNRIDLVERRLRAPETIETTILAVNNPCRDFAIGQSIMVSAIPNFNEFAIQPLAQGIRTHLEQGSPSTNRATRPQ